jgi:hypothetical protein
MQERNYICVGELAESQVKIRKELPSEEQQNSTGHAPAPRFALPPTTMGPR